MPYTGPDQAPLSYADALAVRAGRKIRPAPRPSMSVMIDSGDESGPAQRETDDSTGWALPILRDVGLLGLGGVAGMALKAPRYIAMMEEAPALARAPKYKDAATK